MNLLKNKKNSWLLAVGGLSLLIAIPFLFYLGSEVVVPSRSPASSLPMYVLSAIILAPVLEEISFRGFFTGRKFLPVVSLIFICFFVFTQGSHPLHFSLLGLFLLAFIWHYFQPNKVLLNSSFILNAALFALIHYQIESLASPVIPLTQFGFGLILIWVVLNFGLLRTILFHGILNAVLILILVGGLQFPEQRVHEIETDTYTLQWKRIPLMKGVNGQLDFTQKGVEITSLDAKTIASILTSKETDLPIPLEPFMKYDITLFFKDSVSQKEIANTLLEVLIEEKILTNPRGESGTQ